MNAVATYDFTTYDDNIEKTKKLLDNYCKSWDFQQEECPTTKRAHLQGRMALKVKERMTGVIKKFPGWHLSITSAANIGNNYYVTKEDTRIDGPWSSEDEVVYIPRQVREIEQLREWQQTIVDDANIWNTRTINVIVDTKGNLGKTTLCMHILAHKIGRKIPFSNDFRDIMRMVMDTPVSKLYVFDIPRALRKDQLYQFYAGVEEIKNGYAFDDRYRFREKIFDCPNIWIFSNQEPDLSLLSHDRWALWQINENKLEALPQAEDLRI